MEVSARWVSRKRVAGLWRAFTVDAVTRFITLPTNSLVLCAVLGIASLVFSSEGAAQQRRNTDVEKRGELAASLEEADSRIRGDIETAHPKVALLSPRQTASASAPTREKAASQLDWFDDVVDPPEPASAPAQRPELDEHEALLRKSKTQIGLGSAGLAVSVGLSLAGSLILVNGTIGQENCWSSNGGNCASTGSGIALMALGGLGIIGSAIALRRGRRSKRELGRERAETSLQLGPTSASVLLRF